MWEVTREDGSRRLKTNAVPTIFSFTKIKQKRTLRNRRGTLSDVSDFFINDAVPSTSHEAMEVEFTDETVAVVSAEVLKSEHSYANLTSLPVDTTTSQSSLEPSELLSGTSSSEDPSSILEKLTKKERLILYGKLLKKKKLLLRRYKNKLKYASTKIKTLEKKIKAIEERTTSEEAKILHKLFKKDQITALKKKSRNVSTKFMRWSNETVMKGLQLKFQCGNSGYEELLKQNFPFPSVRTLQRRLQNLKFDCGILDEVFHFMKIKVDSLTEIEKDCMLVLDEMAITPGKIYDASMCKYFGDVTLPEHSGVATHVLVFLLAGVNSRWKQIVAYYFTSNTVFGSVFKEIVFTIFKEADEIGLNILSITSDMGACNQAFWRTLDVNAGRHTIIRNSIQHPLNPSKRIFFLQMYHISLKMLKICFLLIKLYSFQN